MRRKTTYGLTIALLIAVLAAVATQVPGTGTESVGLAHRFVVEIDGMEDLAVREVHGLHCETGIAEELAEGDEAPTLLPAGTRCGPIVLRRVLTDDSQLADWYADTMDGDLDRRNGTITVLDEEGNEVAVYAFEDAWPAAYGTDPLLEFNEIPAIEEVVLAVERIERVS